LSLAETRGRAPVVAQTGGQALVQALRTQGVDLVFGLPGVQLDWLFDALYDERDALRVYHTRHEQAVSYMADGYARTTGRVGVCLTVPGPGLLNAMAGLSTAYACSSPVLCLTGQIPSPQIGAGRGFLHEIKDQLGVVRAVTKWAAAAMTPAAIPGVVGEAFRQLYCGRPRPVAIEVPPDVLQATDDVAPAPRIERPAQPGDPDLLARAAQALGAAERPIIFAGGGILRAGASEPLRLVAEMLEAPVVMTHNGRGAISDRHDLAETLLAAPDLLPTSDVVLAVGTRFLQASGAAWGPKAHQTVIQVDIDPDEIGRNYPPAIGIVADAAEALQALLDLVPRHNRARASRREECRAARRQVAERVAVLEPQGAYMRAIRAALPDHGILVTDITQVGYLSYFCFPVYEPRTFLTSGYQGTLGAAYPTAMGAQAGDLARPVVSVSGDGGFLYNVQELATAVRHGLNVAAVVFNDNAYGNVRRIQREDFGGRTIASDLRNPDFVALAESFGVEGRRVRDPDGLRSALQDVLRAPRPALIEVPVGEMPSPWTVLRAGFVG